MNATLLQRQAALAGVALLAAVGAIALGRGDTTTGPETPGPAVVWREAGVGVARDGAGGCPEPVTSSTVGIVHPVLPCGAKLVVSAGRRAVRTEVVGRGAVGARHAFDLTPALAAALGVSGEASIRWRFAG